MMKSTRTTRGDDQRETGQASRFTQNSSTGSNRSPGGSAPQGTSPSRQSSWLRWLIFIIVLNLLFYAPLLFGSSSGGPTITLSYTSFLQQVQQANVKDVTLTGNAVSGNFKTPLHELQSGTSSTTTYARFSSYVPETGDPTLLPTLEKNGVQVTAQPVQTPWWQTALTILLNALPLLLLVYFGYMAMRNIRQSQQGGGIFGVGRSRAKLYTEERPSTTFADVAGADEAKADLREKIEFLREPQRYANIGAHIPKGVLLVGPTGTGKTLLARAVAGEAGVPFFSAKGVVVSTRCTVSVELHPFNDRQYNRDLLALCQRVNERQVRLPDGRLLMFSVKETCRPILHGQQRPIAYHPGECVTKCRVVSQSFRCNSARTTIEATPLQSTHRRKLVAYTGFCYEWSSGK